MTKNKDTTEARAHWEFVERAARIYAGWPAWKKAQYTDVVGQEEKR